LIKVNYSGGFLVMTLYIYQPGIQPLGQFDMVDADLDAVKGGELGTLTNKTRANTASEKAAYDVFDGYVGHAVRAAVTTTVSTSTRPLWLLDDGKLGYGTLFGQVIGTPAGLSTTGTNLGPHTAAASGKVTCWDKPGIYAVSTDAVSQEADGLVVTNHALLPGTGIRYTTAGLLTAAAGTGQQTTNVGYLVEFETSPFLVTTPPSLVGATASVTRIVFSFTSAM
jgi:hypothetical protein